MQLMRMSANLALTLKAAFNWIFIKPNLIKECEVVLFTAY